MRGAGRPAGRMEAEGRPAARVPAHGPLTTTHACLCFGWRAICLLECGHVLIRCSQKHLPNDNMCSRGRQCHKSYQQEQGVRCREGRWVTGSFSVAHGQLSTKVGPGFSCCSRNGLLSTTVTVGLERLAPTLHSPRVYEVGEEPTFPPSAHRNS